jgi:serine/threonine protein kinase
VLEPFNAYHRWLGIASEELPPSHYRLLGVPLFENDPGVIEHAADQRMAHLRTLQTGQHAAASQKLLNEVATARVCLLNPQKKAAYDAMLREQLAAQSAPTTPTPPAPPIVIPGPSPAPAAQADSPTITLERAPLGELGEYKLLEKLGEGGMGAVYKALHTKLGRTVALKVIRQDRVWDQRAIARFEREMKAVGALDHPNIVRAFDAREVGGIRLLAMEFIEGLDVGELVQGERRLRIHDACEIVRQAAVGLECARQNGLVHRDIKPSNLMLTRHGHIKLLDLGLARFETAQAGEEVTGTDQAVGTIEYMAPEQFSDSRSVDIRADIYSLGCTFYKLLVGHSPFGGPEYSGTTARLMALATKPAPNVQKLRRDVPKELARIIARMLARDPAKRYATPGEVADVLGPFCAGADLPAALALAEGKLLPTEQSSQALQSTPDMISTGLTRLLQQTGLHHVKRMLPARSGAKGRAVQAITFACVCAVSAVAMIGLLIWNSGSSSTKPATDRQEVVAQPARQPCLVLEWPAADRPGTKLVIDGRPSERILVTKDRPDEVRVPLSPGEHKVRIMRSGFEPFEQSVSIVAERNVTVKPAWKKPEPKPVAAVPEVPEPEPKLQPKPKAELELGPERKSVKETPVQQPSAPPPASPLAVVVDPAEKEREVAEDRYTAIAEPAEQLVAAWDFRGALARLEQVRFDDAESTARLAARRKEIERLAAFKTQISEKINAAQPPLKKSSLLIRGIEGDVVKANEEAISANVAMPSVKTESHPWPKLTRQTAQKLMQLAVDQNRADDWISAGLLALVCRNVDLAQRCFDKAQSLGANTDAVRVPLAMTAFREAKSLLAAKDFAEADAVLAALEENFAGTPWLASHAKRIAAVRAAAKRGVFESEAEALYAEAATLFAAKELHELKPLVEKLGADYADSRAATDESRKPDFAEMKRAVAGLGKRLVVRLDGKGDFKSIQAAIDAAAPNGLVEIHDNGPYTEAVKIPKEKDGLTLRGRKGCWPVVSLGDAAGVNAVVSLDAPTATLQRLALIQKASTGRCLGIYSGASRISSVIVFMPASEEGLWSNRPTECRVDGCLLLTKSHVEGHAVFDNCLLHGVYCSGAGSGQFRSCTLLSQLFWNVDTYSDDRPNALLDAIVYCPTQDGPQVICNERPPPPRIENCDVCAKTPFGGRSAAGRGCFNADPKFRDPQNLDFRLMPNSPCRKKASDGGDIGVRYTPEMVEIIKAALELRRRGIIKF